MEYSKNKMDKVGKAKMIRSIATVSIPLGLFLLLTDKSSPKYNAYILGLIIIGVIIYLLVSTF